MNEFYSKIKEDFLELCGAISVEELVDNHRAIELIKEIDNVLKDVSITSLYL